MAWDEALAERIRAALGRRAGVVERKMFGGLAFLLDGKMFCGIAKGELMVRVGPEAYPRALRRAHVRPMDFTGRPMKGYVFVALEGCRSVRAVRVWTERAAEFVSSLEARPRRRKR